MPDIALVVIAYNRPNSLRRLLSSLQSALYDRPVDLVISIDKGGPDEVCQVADHFLWQFGSKKIIQHEKNLGLRKHVLWCGSLVNEYQTIVVFEDDLYVSPGFFKFAVDCSEFYEADDRIAGVSLYKHCWNFIADRPFEPLNTGSDVFFLQHAMSWGQVWTRKKWNQFISWYENTDLVTTSNGFPDAIAVWPETSWLKFHNRYLFDTGKYFVYPHIALSTNFSDSGTHASPTVSYQVPLMHAVCEKYRFETLDKSISRYDVYFENSAILKDSGIPPGLFTVNLYGKKKSTNRYVLSSDKLNYQAIKSFGLTLRPHELNFLNSIPGDGMYIYDTSLKIKNYIHQIAPIQLCEYDLRDYPKKHLLIFSVYKYFKALLNKLRKLKNKLR